MTIETDRRKEQRRTLLDLATAANGADVVDSLFDAIETGQAHNWDPDQFERWLIGVLRKGPA